ncbi:MAG: hypothetical protein A2Y95_07905 [Deltaproteobacteria bacterium RBG_13_65_10]|nr:MAG: hypothetical protein A2Y95_07905 [Deltaproteobacteria bacterium RBG_13_65_10]
MARSLLLREEEEADRGWGGGKVPDRLANVVGRLPGAKVAILYPVCRGGGEPGSPFSVRVSFGTKKRKRDLAGGPAS